MDRFGCLPTSTQNLLEITDLRNRSTVLGIEKIRFNKEYGRIYFNEKPMIDVSHMLKLIDTDEDYRLYPDQSLGLKGVFSDEETRKNKLSEIISYLAVH